MKKIIYPSLFISICLFSLFGCKKENSASPTFDDYFILEHASGVKDTFIVNSPSYFMDLSFVNYKSSVGNYYGGRYVKVFKLFKGTFSDNFELTLAKPDDAITIGQVYRDNTPNQIITSFTKELVAPSNLVYSASITDIQFSEYKPGERITGNFKAYRNGLLWFKGEFSFNPSH